MIVIKLPASTSAQCACRDARSRHCAEGEGVVDNMQPLIAPVERTRFKDAMVTIALHEPWWRFLRLRTLIKVSLFEAYCDHRMPLWALSLPFWLLRLGKL